MEFRKILALRGPNVWANFPVLEAWLDLGQYKDSSSDMLPGFNERLMAWLPTMVSHRCSLGVHGGFFERLRRGTYQGHIIEHVALELQTLAGTDVGYGRTRESNEEGVYKVVIKYEEEDLGRASLDVALRLCLAAINDTPFDIAGEIETLRDLANDVRLGPSTRAIVRAAEKRGIPARRLNSCSLVQLGYGSKQRRILAAETSKTSAIAESIAQDKELTRTLLSAAGVPVPQGRTVDSAEDAWAAAEEIGTPVVVKPRYGNQGRGVATNLTTREQVMAAYAAAREEESTILVEQFIPGGDYRILVVGGRVVAASRREPAHVIGDGTHTVKELIDIANTDPRRSDGHATTLSFIPLNSVSLGVLADQGFTPESVPQANLRVLIRRNGNLSTGGTATDVTDLVHPEVAARAVDAARVVGLDIAGVDVVALDIARPLEDLGGVIVEVNAAPGLRMHLEPSAGTPRPVGEAIVGTLFDEGDQGRIPIVAITGVNGKTTTTRCIAHILRGTGKTVGMTCTDGIYIGNRRIDRDDCAGPQSARNILFNPAVDMAVLETARGGILRAGLGFDKCDVAVVTNIGEGDHLGLADIETIEELAKVKRAIVDVVAPHATAVLNAHDPLVVGMAAHCRGKVLFFSRDPQHPVVVAHRAEGGRAVIVRDNTIILCDGAREESLISLDDVPLTHGGRVHFQVENMLAAAGAAWSLGLSRDLLIDGVSSFGHDLKHSPGRFNLLDIDGKTCVVDYGHNVSSLKALLESLSQFPHARRTAVYTAAGDRRDCDMIQQAEMLGDSFDRVILYEDHYTRGRPQGEIMDLFRKGLSKGERVADVLEVHGAVKAIETALAMTQPGELLLIQADTIDETIDFVRRCLTPQSKAREISVADALIPPPQPVVPELISSTKAPVAVAT